MRNQNILIVLALALFTNMSFAQKENTEQWRPKYHFSPEKNWTNDPNGLVYLDGEWHLFFQHNPFENQWGHMSWGHAVSKDLLTWEEMPLAIPEGEEYIFSGCIVADKNNSSGFFEDKSGLIAIYTADYHGEKENQQMAISKDKGLTWTKYSENPVIAEPSNKDGKMGIQKDFRDPNIFWYEASQKWIMTVSLPKSFKIQFYESTDLKSWKWVSDFGPKGDVDMIWECPAMMSLPIYDVDKKKVGEKAVLLISSQGPQKGYVGMQYFIGEFDGKSFKEDKSMTWPKYLDYGKDYYAAIPFNNTDRKVILGWAASWQYAGDLPTFPWKGQMNLPRELFLQKNRDGLKLIQQPVTEALVSNKWNQVMQMDEMPLSSSKGIEWRVNSHTFNLSLDFEILGKEVVGLKLLQGENEEFVIQYFPSTEELVIDRSKAGKIPNDKFISSERAFLPLNRNTLKLNIFVDNSVVEVFANDGQLTMSDLVFPITKGTSWRIIGSDPQSKVKNIVLKEWEE